MVDTEADVMKLDAEVSALILEKDQHLVRAVAEILKKSSFSSTAFSEKEEALRHLKQVRVALVVVGDIHGFDSVFDAMREIVMASPMSSIILLTDLPGEKVHDRAEGYGILGHVTRSSPSEGLGRLLETFKEISRNIPSHNS
jgi:two-component SAPR family response regulator